MSCKLCKAKCRNVLCSFTLMTLSNFKFICTVINLKKVGNSKCEVIH